MLHTLPCSNRKEPIPDSVQSSPFSSECGVTESGRGGKELSPYEMRKADFTGIKNVTSVAKGAANLDQHVGK